MGPGTSQRKRAEAFFAIGLFLESASSESWTG